MSGLAKAGVSAFKWSAVSTVGRFALQLAAQVFLARLLGPETYGVFGIGMLVLTLSTFLTNFGFGWNLLHKPQLSEEDIRFAFTWQVIAGAIALICLQITAPWIATYFHDARVESVVRWLSITCLLSSATSPSTSLTQRALQFKALGVVQISSYFLGYIAVGIPMAYLGHGVNALVAAWLVQAATALIGTYGIQRHSLKPLLVYGGANAAMRRGGTVFFINVVNWGLNNLDRVALGRLLNAQAVGHYAVGYNLATLPNTLLLSGLQPAFMAAGAQMHGDKRRLASAYQQILATALVLITPFFVGLAMSAPDLIALLYGAAWLETGAILAVLFLGMPAFVIWGITTPVLTNTGRQHHEFWLQLPVLLIAAVAFFVLTKSPLSAAWVAFGVLCARMIVVCISAFQALNMHPRDIAPDLLRGLALSALCALVVWVAQVSVAGFHLPALSLAVGGLAGITLFAVVVLRLPMLLGPHASHMLQRFVPRLQKQPKT